MSDGSDSITTQGSEVVRQDAPALPASSSPPLTPPVTAAPAKPAAPASSGFRRKQSGAWFTIPLLSAGLSLIACAMIIGQFEANRELQWQRNKLQADLKYMQDQINQNHEFLTRLSTDANLAERLAQRQMKLVRQGAAVLELGDKPGTENTSPFRLVNIPPPAPTRPYEPSNDALTRLFGNARIRLYSYGAGALMIALALIVGASDFDPKARE